MAIFSRRTLQRMLNYNATTIGLAATEEHVRRLNQATPATIATEWEVAVLFGLSQFGRVEHEPAATNLDVHFANDDLSFIGEVATVTESGVEDANPLRDFQAEFYRRVRKHPLPVGGFTMTIRDRREGKLFDEKVFYAIPPKGRFGECFDDQFTRFLDAIRARPDLPCQYENKKPPTDMTIRYQPGEASSGGSFPAVGIARSLKRNTLANSLKAKARQLKKAGAGPTVIFACDGGADPLHVRVGRTVGSYGPDEIVGRFLAEHSVSAVVLLTIERPMGPRFEFTEPDISARFFAHPTLGTDKTDAIKAVVERLLNALPLPVNDPTNATSRLRGKDHMVGLSKWRAMHMSSQSVRLSLRSIQEVLAGARSFEDFQRDYFDKAQLINPFRRALDEGRLIEKIEVARNEHEDDDWVSFTFGDDPDPAIAPFSVPKSSSDT